MEITVTNARRIARNPAELSDLTARRDIYAASVAKSKRRGWTHNRLRLRECEQMLDLIKSLDR